MSSVLLLLIGMLRALVEVAGLALLGQGVMALLAGPSREKNPIFQLFRLVASPALRLLRPVTPRVVIDRHLPFVAFFVLFWLWLALAYLKQLV